MIENNVELLTGVRGSGKTHYMLTKLKSNPNNVLLVSKRLQDILKTNEEFKDVRMILYNDYKLEKYKKLFIYDLQDFMLFLSKGRHVTMEYNGLHTHYTEPFVKVSPKLFNFLNDEVNITNEKVLELIQKIEKIEKIEGFKLDDWQLDFLLSFEDSFYKRTLNLDVASGKTYVVILGYLLGLYNCEKMFNYDNEILFSDNDMTYYRVIRDMLLKNKIIYNEERLSVLHILKEKKKIISNLKGKL